MNVRNETKARRDYVRRFRFFYALGATGYVAMLILASPPALAVRIGRKILAI